MYRELGVELTAFTDAIADETDLVDESQAVPGDIILWRYADPTQPGVTYPHAGLLLPNGLTLDCRHPTGVGIHPRLEHPYEVRRVRGPYAAKV
jgi:hypothetical protein